MADHSLIEWTDATWNPVTGCSVISPGCANCYAMKLAGTRLQHHPSRAGLTAASKAGPVWNGQVRLNRDWLDEPLRWRRPRRIFVCAHGDLFHEAVPDAWIDEVFARMALAPHHTFQVLTKRAARMREYLTRKLELDGAHAWRVRGAEVIEARARAGAGFGHGYSEAMRRLAHGAPPLPNVWLGVSAEDQARADERVPELLATPAAVRFLSAEPLLGPLDLRAWLTDDDGCEGCDDNSPAPPRCARRDLPRAEQCPRNFAVWRSEEGPRGPDGAPEWVGVHRVKLDQVIVGGESGPDARPMHPAWPHQLRDQCVPAGVAFFFKQWGAWAHMPERAHFKDAFREPWRRVASDQDGVRPALMFHVGKSAAGRELDGVTWSEFPATAEADR